MTQRLVAEWEPTEKVWVSTTLTEHSWPGCLDAARQQHAAMRDAIALHVPVDCPQDHGIETNDAWVRDFGPIFTLDEAGRRTAHDFVFNCWGGKYEAYQLDDAVPTKLANTLQWTLRQHTVVLEGGAIESDGRGTALLNEGCLSHANRGGHTRDWWQRLFAELFGIEHIVWLPAGMQGDDTDGHIDNLARFITPGMVAAPRAASDHPDHAALEHNWQALQQGRTARGEAIERLELPTPEPRTYRIPADAFNPTGEAVLLPLSHANFLMAGDAVFVPVFGGPSDDTACRRLDDALPDRTVVPIPSDVLCIGLGGVHCLTMQQPAETASL